MIAKIRKGADFAGLARYLYGPGKREEHVDPRAVADGLVLLDDPRAWAGWVADMRLYAGLRPDIARPVWHCSLRAAPEDPVLSDGRWAAIAAQHIEAMGLAEHPWVAVRHGVDHVHIVACRIDPAGRVWRDSHDYARAMRSMRAIERDHGLTRLGERGPSGRLSSTTAAERARARRRGTTPQRARLRDAMHAAAAAAAGAGVAGWERALDERGVLYRAVATREGTIIGYRVSLPGWTDPDGAQVWLKASQVDRALSWTRIRPRLDGTAPAAGDRPRRTRDTRRREPTAAQLAATGDPTHNPGQAFRPLPRVPVVRRGDTQELLDVLILRLRQWGRDIPTPPRRTR